ncbi:hypothetical protein K461DRAFT_318435 [Myriangium duriaei CBS 260.36]|uniref:Uncharacterized protein n=1 Tax=Myriangium duriaei CBS 260.36 TaxID=1168546 RepID=A0A9P4MQM2_9PEZI|nr:hypothetical protein K461DRAFT_318435 [Myriangium duriaei CBS 260.36]
MHNKSPIVMKKSFGARRVPRKIGGDGDDYAESTSSAGNGTAASSDSEAPSFVKRPASKSRKSASLRTSFGPTPEDAGGDTESTGVITPKRTNLSKVAIQRNAERRLAADVPFRSSREVSEERPSYSKDILQELRQSTPSTPANVSASTSDWEDAASSEASRTLDVASKFGSNLARYQAPSAIPTDAEIKEKKERRARLAKEQDFISLDAASDDDDMDDNVTRDETGKLILRPKEKYPETRLVRDDEDIFEDFDEFTTDGKVALGRNAEKEAEKRRRVEMATLIADAEGQDDGSEESDESEAERNAAFEAAQTRSGTYASRAVDEADTARPRTPPRITPLPTLDGVVGRLRARLEEMEIARAAKEQELESLRAERSQIEGEEVRVQTALKETAEKFAKLRESTGVSADTQVAIANGHGDEQGPSDLAKLLATQSRGRGGLGLGASVNQSGESDEDDEY